MSKIPEFGEKLSKREFEILKNIYYELPEMAERLDISENTAKTHLQSIYKKLGCNKRQQAVLLALKTKLIKLNQFETD